MTNFYVSVRSDSSLEHYPENNPSKFTNKLAKAIELDDDDYEVSIASLFLNLPFSKISGQIHRVTMNIDESIDFDDFRISKHLTISQHMLQVVDLTIDDRDSFHFSLQKIDSLIAKLYEGKSPDQIPKLNLDLDRRTFTLHCPHIDKRSYAGIMFDSEMMELFGFGDNFKNSTFFWAGSTLYFTSTPSDEPSKLLLIESNIVHETDFGDELRPIIGLTSQSHHFNKVEGYERFSKREYRPVRCRRFEEITIRITDEKGYFLRLGNFVLITLHFRKTYKPANKCVVKLAEEEENDGKFLR